MRDTVGIAELRQNLSVYLRRVANGERLIVTDRNRPVAELGPPSTPSSDLDRLTAEGRVSRPIRRTFRPPLRPDDGDRHALTLAPGRCAWRPLSVAVVHAAASALVKLVLDEPEGDVLRAFVAYDERQAAAARSAGLRVVAPGSCLLPGRRSPTFMATPAGSAIHLTSAVAALGCFRNRLGWSYAHPTRCAGGWRQDPRSIVVRRGRADLRSCAFRHPGRYPAHPTPGCVAHTVTADAAANLGAVGPATAACHPIDS